MLPGTVWVGIRAYSVYVGRLPASVGFVLRIFPGNIEKSGVYDDEDLQACSCSRQAQTVALSDTRTSAETQQMGADANDARLK